MDGVQIRRSKACFTRDRCRFFITHNVEFKNGLISLKVYLNFMKLKTLKYEIRTNFKLKITVLFSFFLNIFFLLVKELIILLELESLCYVVFTDSIFSFN